MLGFDDQKTLVIKEPYKSQLLEKLKRYRNGEFNEEDLKLFKRQKEILQKYDSVWIDDERDKK